jgi:hypothetical protein
MRKLLLLFFLLAAGAAQAGSPSNTYGWTGSDWVPVIVDSSGNIVISGSGGGGAPLQTIGSPSSQTNSASTITTGGTFQTIAASSTSRRSLEFQNVCNKSGNCTATTDNCYLYIAGSGTPTTAKSIVVAPGQSYLRSSGAIPSDAIQATCDSNGDAYYLAVQ